jgi:hypothetical protein
VQLSGTDGNAYSILGAVNRALVSEATAGDYYHLLATAMRWVDCG